MRPLPRAGAAVLRAELPRLHVDRYHRRGSRWRDQECDGDRRGHFRRPRLRREHAHRADRSRPGGNDAPGRRARAREKKHSWDWPGWAIWCSPAPTISRAIAASAWRSRPVRTSKPRRRRSARSSKACSPLSAVRTCRATRGRGDADLRAGLSRRVRRRRAERCGQRIDEPGARSRVDELLQLPPRFVHHHRGGVGQVQAAIAGAHRNASGAARPGKTPTTLAASLASPARTRMRRRRELRLIVASLAARRDREPALHRQRVETFGQRIPRTNIREIRVVHAGATHGFFADVETERPDQMQRSSRCWRTGE